jgi:hypothetical protein
VEQKAFDIGGREISGQFVASQRAGLGTPVVFGISQLQATERHTDHEAATNQPGG